MGGCVCLPGPRPVLICSDICVCQKTWARERKEGEGKTLLEQNIGRVLNLGVPLSPFSNDHGSGVSGGRLPLVPSPLLCLADLQDTASLAL